MFFPFDNGVNNLYIDYLKWYVKLWKDKNEKQRDTLMRFRSIDGHSKSFLKTIVIQFKVTTHSP